MKASKYKAIQKKKTEKAKKKGLDPIHDSITKVSKQYKTK